MRTCVKANVGLRGGKVPRKMIRGGRRGVRDSEKSRSAKIPLPSQTTKTTQIHPDFRVGLGVKNHEKTEPQSLLLLAPTSVWMAKSGRRVDGKTSKMQELNIARAASRVFP